MTDQTLKQRYGAAMMNTFGIPKLALVRGEGAHVWDEDGKEYVDLLGGIAVNALGHGHPSLVAAVTEQLQTLGHISNLFLSRPQVELAEKLLELLTWVPEEVAQQSSRRSGRVFFTNSGAEANEAALKISRRLRPGGGWVAAEGAFEDRPRWLREGRDVDRDGGGLG